MMGITLANAYTITPDNNGSVLGLLKNLPGDVPQGPVNTVLVPVPDNVDVASILSEQGSAKLPASEKSGENSADLAFLAADEVADDEPELDPASFVELSALQPKTRQQQLATVLFQRFPALKRQYIDQVLLKLVQRSPDNVLKQFRFSIVREGHAADETKNVFVQFSSVLLAEWLHKNKDALFGLFPDADVVFDAAVDGESAQHLTDDVIEELKKEIWPITKNKKRFSKGSRRTGTEDLDEVMQYYKTYKVESLEIVEVPKDMKETIVKDIIKFRSKMLSIEREQRKKEIERERRKAKARLTAIFEGIKAAADTGEDVDMDPAAVDEEEESKDPLDELSDEQYEQHLANIEKKKLEDEYEAQLRDMEKRELQQKTLVESLALARNYESNLIENKFTYMEDIKAFQDLRFSSESSTVSSKLRLYYSNHLEYRRLRNSERMEEERLDSLNEIEEKKETQHTKPAAVVSKAPETTEKMDVDEPTVTSESVAVGELPAKKLAEIKSKISDLIVEYLGIKENVLIDFIYEFVVENGLSKKDDLVTELQETLDDDSTTLVESLHAFIRALS